MYIESPYIQRYVHMILLVLTAYSSVECLKLSVSYSNKQIGTPYHQISISSTTNYCRYTWRSSTYGDMVSLIPVAYSRTEWLKLFVSYGTERYGVPNFFLPITLMCLIPLSGFTPICRKWSKYFSSVENVWCRTQTSTTVSKFITLRGEAAVSLSPSQLLP